MLRALLETYFLTAISFLYLLGSINVEGQSGRVEFLTWLITGAFLLGFPIFAFRLLFKSEGKLDSASMRAKFDSLY